MTTSHFILLVSMIHFLYQVADVVLHEGQTFDLSMVLHLVTILCDRASYEPKGFMCIVCHFLALSLHYVLVLKKLHNDELEYDNYSCVRMFAFILGTQVTC